MIPGISDLTSEALRASIRGLGVRRQAIENNIANVETPGYQARVVSFEDSLMRAVSQGAPGSFAPSVTSSTAPTRENGNNVAIDEEVTALTQTALQHQLSVEALNAKYRLLRTAITGM